MQKRRLYRQSVFAPEQTGKHIAGWLEKKEGVTATWRRHWFQVEGSELHFYAAARARTLRAAFDLYSGAVGGGGRLGRRGRGRAGAAAAAAVVA